MRRTRPQLRPRALLTLVVFVLGTIGGTFAIACGFLWTRRCQLEATRCDREARYWANGAQQLRASAGFDWSRLAEQLRPQEAVDAAWFRRGAARERYLADRADRIAGRFREEAGEWRRWRMPLVPADPRTYWVEPADDHLVRYTSP